MINATITDNDFETISFDLILDSLEISVYWKNIHGIYQGCNKYAANMVKLSSPQDIVGKSDYDLFDVKIAKAFVEHDKLVVEKNEIISLEEEVISPDGKLLTQLSIKKPIYNKSGKIIGVVGNTMNITSNKENEAAEKQAQARWIKFIDFMSHHIQKFKVEELRAKLGDSPLKHNPYEKIKLTKREDEILYLVAMGKSPKEIAQILGRIDNKNISDSTISSIISKKLYTKFQVFSYGELVDKAITLDMIRLIPDSFVTFLKDKINEL